MKKFLIGCSFAVVVAVVVAFGADGRSTNFSGTWVLDKAKSQGLPPQMENLESYTMIVSQDGTQLTVENKIAGGRRPDGGPGGFGDRPNRSSADPGAAGQGGPPRPGGGRG